MGPAKGAGNAQRNHVGFPGSLIFIKINYKDQNISGRKGKNV
jgi:hypothetical protein